MSRSELQEWLIELASFQSRLCQLTAISVAEQFPLAGASLEPPGQNDLRYLLMCASLLATSDGEKEQDAALRIAHFSLTGSDNPEQRAAAAFILDQLANHPAISLGQSREVIPPDFFDRISGPLLLEHWRRRLALTVESASGEELHLNRFQKRVWDGARECEWLSVSAPTSAGKSFIIKKLIEHEARRLKSGVAVYLVPTRALIQEVESDFIQYFKAQAGDSTAISSMPLAGVLSAQLFNVLVLTQERYHLLQTARPDLAVDWLVVDEAHKMGDRQRGVLLQQVIDRTASCSPGVRVLFASPHTDNPGVLLGAAPESSAKGELRVEQVTVNQNLLWAKQVPGHPTRWALSLVLDEEERPLGEFCLAGKPQPESKRLPFVAHALGSQGGNLIYVNSAAAAEKAANQLYELLPSDGLSESSVDAIAPLVELARTTVHRSYALARVLGRGVAFHYGNMPFLMRSEIERLFKDGHIKYLVCTSTLLEGVNLPCRNIFIRGPRTGRGNPMSMADFWNLAGRAGRWGSEFQGNVVCVDVQRESLWPNGRPMRKTRTRITPATRQVAGDLGAFLKWVQSAGDEDPPTQFPQILNYLVAEHGERESIVDLYWLSEAGDSEREALQQVVQEVADSLEVPLSVVARNPGIDPRLMNEMLSVFEKRPSPLVDLLPPDSASDDALDGFIRVFSLINRGFGPVFGESRRRVFQLALLVTQWLQGRSLSRLIQGRVRALKRLGREVRLAHEIRLVMSDVENYARFAIPKYLACYLDVLAHFLGTRGEDKLLAQIGDYGLLLEFGVSENTQLSLISMGLSRTTVVSLFELMPESDWDVRHCMAWLKSQDLEALDLPVLVRREVVRKFPEVLEEDDLSSD